MGGSLLEKAYPWKRGWRGGHPLIGVVLAAGQSTRLRPVLGQRPKPLLPLTDGTPLLVETMARLASTDSVDEVIVVTGYRHEAIASALEQIDVDLPVSLVWNEEFDELGPVTSVRCAVEDLADDDLLLMNGDTFFATPALNEMASIDADGLWLACTPARSFEDDDVRVVADGRRLEAVGKGLGSQQAGYRSAGLLRVRGAPQARAFVDTVQDLDRAERNGGERRIWHAVIDRLAAELPVHVMPVEQGTWFEIDTPEDYDRFLTRLEKDRQP